MRKDLDAIKFTHRCTRYIRNSSPCTPCAYVKRKKRIWQEEVENLEFDIMRQAAHRVRKDLLTSELVEFFRESVQGLDVEDNNSSRDLTDIDIERLL